MTTNNSENSVTPTSVSGFLEPREEHSKSESCISPPTSPSLTKGALARETRRPAANKYSPLSPPPTPRKLQSTTVKRNQTTHRSDDVATLRTRLAIDDKKCGAIVETKGGVCRRWSPAANRIAVTSKLQSIVGLTQSSTELEGNLDELSNLVHCQEHCIGPPKTKRIGIWIQTFPVGEPNATILIPREIRQLLDLDSSRCIGEVDKTDPRCTKHIGGQRVYNCVRTIAGIIEPNVYLNEPYLNGMLKVLETNMYCPDHINKRPLQNVSTWKSSIEKIRDKYHDKPVGSTICDEAGVTIDPQNRGASPGTPPLARAMAASPGSARSSIPKFDGDLSTYWQHEHVYKISPFVIRERSRGLDDHKSSYDKIEEKMKKSLGEERESGYIYVYEVEGNSGFVKIGFTGRSVKDRLADWEHDCNRVPKLVYQYPSATVAKAPNARRVEGLCHAELYHRKTWIYCDCCFKWHHEWFEISSRKAIATVRKWCNWMAKNPYHDVGTLREEEVEKTRDMDKFMKDIAGSI
ncbi:hypothetical protein FLONG3_491 [Fusarium longipes]|uniref:Bacteriophage T5 Orf172 DNA-binding domain-containing protein n=1 Tax=Fusarium longipes TaxID=694270 RepID=A0A395TA15_9HYPO|nr:hypothetical protein FLONG3_491 [Fusarium longipes]